MKNVFWSKFALILKINVLKNIFWQQYICIFTRKTTQLIDSILKKARSLQVIDFIARV